MIAYGKRWAKRSRAGGRGWLPARARGRALAASLCLSLACPWGGPTTGSAALGDNDRVSILQSTSPAVLVVDGKGRTKCLVSELFEGTGIIDLNDRVVDDAPICASEVVAFAGDRAVELDAAPAWSHDPANPLKLPMEPPITIELRFYVPQAPGVADAADAKDEMDQATALFAKNRAGIALTSVSTLAYSTAQGAVIGDDCDEAANLALTDTSDGLYDPTRINVYYVSKIKGENFYLGYNCYEEPIVVGGNSAIGENVIYLSSLRAPTTLAHELGHALALRDPVGHTLGITGFTTKNLMMGGISWALQAAQDHFSLGQGYRMSLDQLSWLNHSRPNGAAAIRPGNTRSCQLTAAAAAGDPCPPLALDK